MSFEVFNLRRIDTWILSNNLAEISTVKSVGFIEEGSKRQAVYKCGEYLDCKLFGLLRNEWSTSPEVISLRASTDAKSNPGVCNASYRPKNEKGSA